MDIALSLDAENLDLAFDNGDFLIIDNSKRDRVVTLLRSEPGDFMLDKTLGAGLESFINGNLADSYDEILTKIKTAFEKDKISGIEIDFEDKNIFIKEKVTGETLN
jgi:hypothetical protein